jgi:hypothetical protein
MTFADISRAILPCENWISETKWHETAYAAGSAGNVRGLHRLTIAHFPY